MAQDMWIVPIMALVPILAHTTGQGPPTPLWQTLVLVIGVLAGILVVGRWLSASGRCRMVPMEW